MQYELVKYRYGMVRRFTAFCLTPKLEKPKIRVFDGKEAISTNKGPAARQARHFQWSDTAKRHLALIGQPDVGFDWTPLAGTEVRI